MALLCKALCPNQSRYTRSAFVMKVALINNTLSERHYFKAKWGCIAMSPVLLNV